MTFHTLSFDFIYARKIYVCTHGKITRQWKSTLRDGGKGNGCGGRALRYTLFLSHTIKPNSNCYILTSKNYEKVTDRDSKFIRCCVGCVDNVFFVARRLETK